GEEQDEEEQGAQGLAFAVASAPERLVIGSLLEELRDLAGRAQRAQVAKLQHEAEVAGFFTVAAPRGAAVPAPPPMSALSAAGGGDPWAGARGGDSYKPGGRFAPEALCATDGLAPRHELAPGEAPPPTPGLATGSLRKSRRCSRCSTHRPLSGLIRTTQAKMEEVSSLVGLFATKVAEQQEMADNIHDLAVEATDYVENAEKHLQRAVENSNSYRFYVVCWFLGSSLFLILFDQFDQRFSLI
ncbi:unnamed protein product, partial [Prorocentrum cordatum]